MSIIVSDTSPIRALEHLGLLRLLGSYYGQVFIPPNVADELHHSRAGLKSIDVTQHPMFQVVAPKPMPQLSTPWELAPGESEAITLALELGADYLLITRPPAAKWQRKWDCRLSVRWESSFAPKKLTTSEPLSL